MDTSLVDLTRRLLARLKPGDPSRSILPFIPRPIKWLCLLILLVNCRGLPLTWHIRVFRPAIYARLYHALRNLFDSPEKRVARLTRISPVGVNPFKSETVFKTRATPDACDFNMHLSNSSYAMTYDMVRFKYVIEHFPLFYRDGGWIALGATHYMFTREIPLNASYEIRLSVATWDQKWMYMVARYVTYPKAKPKSASVEPTYNGPSSVLALPSIVTPANSASPSAAPSPSRSPAPPPSSLGIPLPPGAVLHCTAISRLCCKIGRITIPPMISITSSGFAISHKRFAEIQSWRFRDNGKRIREFYRGGWRNVPEGERWWEEALGGDIERQRIEGLRGLAAGVGVSIVI